MLFSNLTVFRLPWFLDFPTVNAVRGNLFGVVQTAVFSILNLRRMDHRQWSIMRLPIMQMGQAERDCDDYIHEKGSQMSFSIFSHAFPQVLKWALSVIHKPSPLPHSDLSLVLSLTDHMLTAVAITYHALKIKANLTEKCQETGLITNWLICLLCTWICKCRTVYIM